MKEVGAPKPPAQHPRLFYKPVEITTPTAHAAALHPTGRPGRVAVARRVGAGRNGWREEAYPVRELPEALPALAGQSDVYISQNRFGGWRRIAQLRELGALYVDLDYRKRPDLAGSHPLGVLQDALICLERARIPAPSMAIGSGRGLYLVWLHGPVPRGAICRWNACQRRLYEVLRTFGADRGALDAARVLRLIGTRHSRAGVVVEALAPLGELQDFDTLADEVLPMTRAELHDLRVQRALRRPQERLWGPPEGYTGETLWEARLADLQALRRLRWFGDLPPGQRDYWMFIAGVAMSWLAPLPVLQRELFALAKEAARWDEPEARNRLSAVMNRARMAARGERVEWGGVKVDSRYRLRSETILELLEVTPAEERQMLTIISSDERRRRDRLRKQEERRKAGAMSRREYEDHATMRRYEVGGLRSEGLSVKQIAAQLEVSERHVKRLLKASPVRG
jgi:AraC-like DNA-binding protein